MIGKSNLYRAFALGVFGSLAGCSDSITRDQCNDYLSVEIYNIELYENYLKEYELKNSGIRTGQSFTLHNEAFTAEIVDWEKARLPETVRVDFRVRARDGGQVIATVNDFKVGRNKLFPTGSHYCHDTIDLLKLYAERNSD